MTGSGGKSAATWQHRCQKFFKNQGLAERFWSLFPHFLVIKEISCRIKEIIFVFSINAHIRYSFFHNILKRQYKFWLIINQGNFFYQETYDFVDIKWPKNIFLTKWNLFFMSDFCFFTESFMTNFQVTRSTFDWWQLSLWLKVVWSLTKKLDM